MNIGEAFITNTEGVCLPALIETLDLVVGNGRPKKDMYVTNACNHAHILQEVRYTTNGTLVLAS